MLRVWSVTVLLLMEGILVILRIDIHTSTSLHASIMIAYCSLLSTKPLSSFFSKIGALFSPFIKSTVFFTTSCEVCADGMTSTSGTYNGGFNYIRLIDRLRSHVYLCVYARTYVCTCVRIDGTVRIVVYLLTGCATIHCARCFSSEVKEVAGRHDVELAMIT